MDYRNNPTFPPPQPPPAPADAGLRPEAGIFHPQNPEADGPQGLGGWLTLVGIGLFVGPIHMLFTLGPDFLETFSPEVWPGLTEPGSGLYHPSWAALLITELAGNTLLFLVRIYLIFLFFSQKKLFPRLFVIVMMVTPVFIYLDALWATRIINEVMGALGEAPDEVLDPDTMGELSRALIYLCIWGPYMKISKRVKNTFIHPREESLSRVF